MCPQILNFSCKLMNTSHPSRAWCSLQHQTCKNSTQQRSAQPHALPPHQAKGTSNNRGLGSLNDMPPRTICRSERKTERCNAHVRNSSARRMRAKRQLNAMWKRSLKASSLQALRLQSTRTHAILRSWRGFRRLPPYDAVLQPMLHGVLGQNTALRTRELAPKP